jgi:hypothetical protein
MQIIRERRLIIVDNIPFENTRRLNANFTK